MKFKKTEKKLFGTLGMFVYISGATLYVFDRWVRVTTSIGAQHHPAEHWIRAGHSLLTYLVILSVGYLIKAHVIPGLRAEPRRRVSTGITVLTAVGLLLISALVILYGGEGDAPELIADIHAYLGLFIPLIVGAHIYGLIETKKNVKSKAPKLRRHSRE